MDYLADVVDDGEPDEDDLGICSDDDDETAKAKKANREPVTSGVVDDQVLFQVRTVGKALTGGNAAGAEAAGSGRNQTRIPLYRMATTKKRGLVLVLVLVLVLRRVSSPWIHLRPTRT